MDAIPSLPASLAGWLAGCRRAGLLFFFASMLAGRVFFLLAGTEKGLAAATGAVSMPASLARWLAGAAAPGFSSLFLFSVFAGQVFLLLAGTEKELGGGSPSTVWVLPELITYTMFYLGSTVGSFLKPITYAFFFLDGIWDVRPLDEGPAIMAFLFLCTSLFPLFTSIYVWDGSVGRRSI
jgi:hypothetical protein